MDGRTMVVDDGQRDLLVLDDGARNVLDEEVEVFVTPLPMMQWT